MQNISKFSVRRSIAAIAAANLGLWLIVAFAGEMAMTRF